jgi:hypothetical protein
MLINPVVTLKNRENSALAYRPIPKMLILLLLGLLSLSVAQYLELQTSPRGIFLQEQQSANSNPPDYVPSLYQAPLIQTHVMLGVNFFRIDFWSISTG